MSDGIWLSLTVSNRRTLEARNSVMSDGMRATRETERMNRRGAGASVKIIYF
jgi:hypothetical protein